MLHIGIINYNAPGSFNKRFVRAEWKEILLSIYKSEEILIVGCGKDEYIKKRSY
jgi:hypothetical protein